MSVTTRKLIDNQILNYSFLNTFRGTLGNMVAGKSEYGDSESVNNLFTLLILAQSIVYINIKHQHIY